MNRWLPVCATMVGLVSCMDSYAAPWVFEPGGGRCTLRQSIGGGLHKPDIEVALTWHGVEGQGADVTPSKPFATDSLIRIRSKNSQENWSRLAQDSGPIARSKAVYVLKQNLSRGLPILVSIEGSGRSVQYATSLENAGPSLAAFEACIRDEIARVANEDRAERWRSEPGVHGTCSMILMFTGDRNLHARFDDGPPGLVFQIIRSLQASDAATLRIELPGQPAWLLKTGSDALDDPRTAMLLEQFRKNTPPPMFVLPDGGAARQITPASEGMTEAVAMFDACSVMRRRPRPEVLSLTVQRHDVAESARGCELSASYRSDATTIWLKAVSSDDGYRLEMATRHERDGERIRFVDLRSLGGPPDAVARDARFSLDTARFASLMRAARSGGGKVRLLATPDREYPVLFGGPHAQSEVAMFDACVRAKYPSRP